MWARGAGGERPPVGKGVTGSGRAGEPRQAGRPGGRASGRVRAWWGGACASRPRVWRWAGSSIPLLEVLTLRVAESDRACTHLFFISFIRDRSLNTCGPEVPGFQALRT